MASQQLLHHHPLNTSITVLDTVSVPTAEQYAFAFEILPSTPSNTTTTTHQKYPRKSTLNFQTQRRHLEVHNHRNHSQQQHTQQHQPQQLQDQSNPRKLTIMSSTTITSTNTTTTSTSQSRPSSSTATKNAITYIKNNFHYLLPAILLNPILFLHALNGMLTGILPDLNIPYSTRTWFQPHLDINHNNAVASIYTVLIIVLQGFACQYCLDVSARQNVRQAVDGSKADDGDDYWQGD